MTWGVLFPNAGWYLSPLAVPPGDGSTQGRSGWRRSRRPVHSAVHRRDLPQLLRDGPFRPVQPQHNERRRSRDSHPSHLPRCVQPGAALHMAPHAAARPAVRRGTEVQEEKCRDLCSPSVPSPRDWLTCFSSLHYSSLHVWVLFTCRHTDPHAEAVVQRDLHLPFCHQQLSRGIGGWHFPRLWVRTAPAAASGTFVLEQAGRFSLPEFRRFPFME